MDALRGGKADVAFGSQIRNYVLHPYQMLKDLRTGQETGATGAVLDGEIDDFVEAVIRWRRETATDGPRRPSDRSSGRCRRAPPWAPSSRCGHALHS